jgi:hypothetical protein
LSWLLPAVATFLVSSVLWWATVVWACLPSGSLVFQRWSIVWLVAFFVALLVLPLALAGVPFRRLRGAALRTLSLSVAFLLGFLLGARGGSWQQVRLLESLPDRAAPLIGAISRFEAARGRPPDSLDDLVPGFIPAIPATGFGGYPEWSYERQPYVDHPDHAGLYGGNAWALNVYIAGRPTPGYRLLYLPNKAYRTGVPRMGDWARLHY